MNTVIICAILIVLSIDLWLRHEGFHFVLKEHPKIKPDYHHAFTSEGIRLDETTYRKVIEFMEGGNIEAAEYLMMIRCKSPLEKVRHAIDGVYIEMYGSW